MRLDKTISTIFIVPTLRIKGDYQKDHNFINGYVWDLKREVNYENAVYLLFKPKNIDRFKEFVDDEYARGGNSPLIEDYDYKGGFVVLVYTLDPIYKDDFELVKMGKYSRTSDEFQEIFKKVIILVEKGHPREKVSLQWKIFNKSDDLREDWETMIGIDFKDDMEVWSTFVKENETLDIEKVKQEL